MKWINIKDELPKNDEPVLTYQINPYKEFEINVLWYDKYDKNFKDFNADGDNEENIRDIDGYYPNVTHWMPLPEKP